jgi:hypothetical protein
MVGDSDDSDVGKGSRRSLSYEVTGTNFNKQWGVSGRATVYFVLRIAPNCLLIAVPVVV